MKFDILEKNVSLNDSTKERLYKKIGKLDKFFHEDAATKVKVIAQKDKVNLEITIYSGDIIVRAQAENSDAKAAIDEIVGLLERQIRKNKTRIEKRLRENAFQFWPPEMSSQDVEEEKEFKVVKTKKFSVKPMSVEEAILQMNLLGHQFYVFTNAETNDMDIVYKRKDGYYGIIETD